MTSRRSLPTLFITYDGLLDPLGGSQILPYLLDIAAHPRLLHIVSFEKPKRHATGASAMRAYLADHGIGWTPLSFTQRGGKLGKLWDLARMYVMCVKLQRQHRFEVIHCRSYQAMQVGNLLNRLTGAKTIFDMRGLWVDDRVEGGLWTQDEWLNRLLYRYYKRAERTMLTNAHHVVVLTNRVVPEINKLAPGMTAPVSVIPCCADFDHFSLQSNDSRVKQRDELGLPSDAVVLSYLGSLGTIYLLDDMLRLFDALAHQHAKLHMLFITQDWRSEHEELVKKIGLDGVRHRIHVRPANRKEVPALLGLSDVMVSFRRPTYSQMACSPTKLAEAFALGLPVISNAGVGDVDDITRELDAGAVVDLGEAGVFQRIAADFDSIRAKGGESLRQRARVRFGLEVAERSYRQVYDALERVP